MLFDDYIQHCDYNQPRTVTLLDTGATANFSCPWLVRQLGLQCKKTDATGKIGGCY